MSSLLDAMMVLMVTSASDATRGELVVPNVTVPSSTLSSVWAPEGPHTHLPQNLQNPSTDAQDTAFAVPHGLTSGADSAALRNRLSNSKHTGRMFALLLAGVGVVIALALLTRRWWRHQHNQQLLQKYSERTYSKFKGPNPLDDDLADDEESYISMTGERVARMIG